MAVLALTQPARWERQAAVARALHGKPGVTTFESLAPVLAGFSDNPADPATAATVRQFVPASEFFLAPAALSFAASPEEKILAPLGMAAWDDPVGALIAAVRDGSISLTIPASRRTPGRWSPWLANLERVIQDGADPGAALAIIREAAATPGRTGRFAATLLEQITANPGRGLQE